MNTRKRKGRGKAFLVFIGRGLRLTRGKGSGREIKGGRTFLRNRKNVIPLQIICQLLSALMKKWAWLARAARGVKKKKSSHQRGFNSTTLNGGFITLNQEINPF